MDRYPAGSGPFGSLFFHILPYIEEDLVYKAASPSGTGLAQYLVYSANSSTPTDETAMNYTIKTFVSPTDSNNANSNGHCSYASNGLVFTNGARYPQVFGQKGSTKCIILFERSATTLTGTSTFNTYADNTVGQYPQWVPIGMPAALTPVPNLGTIHYWNGYNTSLPYGNYASPGSMANGAVFGYPTDGAAMPAPVKGILNPPGGSVGTWSTPNLPPAYTKVTVVVTPMPLVTQDYTVGTIPAPTSVADPGYPNEDAPSALSGNVCQVALGDGSVRSVSRGIASSPPNIASPARPATWQIVIDPKSQIALDDTSGW